MEIRAIRLHPQDDVAVLTQAVRAGEQVLAADERLTAREDIPQGHKIAVRAIPAGGMIHKYGIVIGQASQDIAPGQWVHTHNVTDITEQLCDEYARQYRARVAKEGR